MSKWCWHRWGLWEQGRATMRSGFVATIQERQCKKCGKYQTEVLTNMGWQ